jgi:hypothetical protein
MIPIDWHRMYHQQNLQLCGVHVPEMDVFTNGDGHRLFRFFELGFSFEDSEIDPVPIRLPIVSRDMTPYSFQSNRLLYEGEQLVFTGVTIHRVPFPPEESDWHFKGYTFPFRGTKNPYHELRLNLRISGFCPGRCLFCHRWHSHRLKPNKRRLPSPRKVLDRIVEAEGPEVFTKIEQVMFISELFGQENQFLQRVSDTHCELTRRGYPEDKPFGCCAQDVRSLSGHKALLDIVRPARYSFSLEIFRDRNELMGLYKGLPIEHVYRILRSARCAGFKEITLNYLAGIDSLDECARGFERLVHLGLVDSVGLSTFTFFSEQQKACRHETAWVPSYYLHVVEVLNSLGIKIHNPESFDMGSPYTILMEKV